MHSPHSNNIVKSTRRNHSKVLYDKFQHIDTLYYLSAREYLPSGTRVKNKNPRVLLRVHNSLIALEFDSDGSRAAHSGRIFSNKTPFSALILLNHFVGDPPLQPAAAAVAGLPCTIARARGIRAVPTRVHTYTRRIGSHYSRTENLTVIVRNFKIWIQ